MIFCCIPNPADVFIQSALPWAQALFYAVSSISILFAIVQYSENNSNKHAEWLSSLYKMFYEEEKDAGSKKEVRDILDGQYSEKRFNEEELKEKFAEEAAVNKLGDYLNFFEFIASLNKMGRLTEKEILLMFRYYLFQIKRSPFLMGFLEKYEFKNLLALLKRLKDKKLKDDKNKKKKGKGST